MAGKSTNSFGSKNFAPGPPATRYNASGKNREFYTYENAPGIGAYATGGTIIDGGDGYIYHIFTGTGTFVVNRPSAAIDSVDYLIVGGGGSTLNSFAAGGGGGGGFLFGNTSVTQTPYPVVVGAAGASVPGAPGTPRNGSLSSAFGISAAGGGGGAAPPVGTGGNGGSGGGGSSNSGGAGSGNTPATIPRQGYPGGQGGVGPTNGSSGAGGGGAGGFGGAGSPPPAVGGSRGLGRIAPEFPSTIVRQGIPAPALPSWEPLVGPEGYAGGGGGSPFPGTSRGGPDNSGYGGDVSFLGGSGIVCIRYKKTAAYSRATGGTVEPSTNPEHIGVVRHIFTGPGTFAVTDPTLQYIDYLAVGGGGGGGGSPFPGSPGLYPGGGGGAGGFVSSIHTSTTTPTSTPQAYPWNPGYAVQVAEQYPVGPGSYPISVGAGGASGTAGSNTTIGVPGPAQIIAAGGGAGGSDGGGGVGGAGGSGGGASTGGPVISGGTATPSPLIQGNDGGNAGPNTPGGAGGGGGGAGGSGGPSPSLLPGGIGWYSVLSPSAYGTTGPLTPNPLYRYFAGGGGGARYAFPSSRNGGSGGGGNTNTAGTVNTGGGGGGANTQMSGGAGGSGIVIIQYPE